MKSLKVKSCLIIALALVMISALCAAFVKTTPASADSVTISGSSVFYKAGDAQVKASGEADTDDHYTMFVFNADGDAVNYNRNNLAYKWFANSATKTVTEGEGENQKEVTVEDEANPVRADGWFNMEIGFNALDFEKFVITFESQQYVKNKDEKTTNYLIFTPSGTDKVKVAIGNDKDAEPETSELDADNIKIAFSESSIGGNYKVTVTSSNEVSGEFENIGGTFSKYSTSSTTPVTPLSFKAEFSEEEEAAKKACMVLYNLNGQSFKLKDASKGESDEYYGGGTIDDNVAPVLCLKQNVNYFNAGTEINTDFFTAIDVIKQSPSSTAAYFILDNAQATASSTDFKPEDMSENGAFTVLKDGDGQRLILHENHYYPTSYSNSVYDDDFRPVGVVKIYFKLTDTSYNGTSTYVLLDWYVKKDNLIEINGSNYIAVADDNKGVSFTHTSNGTTNLNANEWTSAISDYQNAVTKAAEGLKAGSKNYFYVPAAEGLFTDNSTEFTDLSFTVYYMSDKNTNFSSTSGKASALSIPLSNTGSEYVFTILASDAASNSMYYYDKGEKQEITASASNILDMWNDENDDQKYLPWFRFEVGTSEMSVEEPEEQDVAYKDVEYSFEFDINAVSGTYTSKYELFVFVNDRYLKQPFDENGNPDENGNGKSLSYEAFMEKKDWLFENHREWFDVILSTSEYESGTAEEEKYGGYAWNGTSRFTPQQGNAFYLVKLTLTANDQRPEVTEYMGIASSIQVTPLKGEDTWLQDNMTSVILLCVAGAALIGIILLLVIKPKDKGDVDEKVFLPEKKSKTQKPKKQ